MSRRHSRRWLTDASTVGMPGPLLVRDPEDGPEGRVVCAVPGHLRRRFSEQDAVQLLDKEDLAHARLIEAAPALHGALAELVQWAERMGGWEARCWDEARALLGRLRGTPRSGGAGGGR